LQTTAVYILSQNSHTEQAIQNTEEEVCLFLKEVNLPVEFWCYAAEAGVYIRNCLTQGLKSVKKKEDIKIKIYILSEKA
jgi:hypothetical protein